MKVRNPGSLIDKVKRVFPSARSEAGLTELLSAGHRNKDFYELRFWFEEIFFWLGKDRHLANSEDPAESNPSESARFRYFFRTLENNPEWKITFSENFATLLRETRFLNFFAQTGLATEHGLWTDIFSRISNRLFPMTGGKDFQSFIKTVFSHDDDIVWIRSLPDNVLLKLKDLLFPKPSEIEAMSQQALQDLQSALLIISAHLAHHGVSYEIRTRLTALKSISDSNFLMLSAAVQNAVYGQNQVLSNNSGKTLEEMINLCRADIESVYDHMENTGVSVGVVHKLEILLALLDRLQLLLNLQKPRSPIEKIRNVRDIITASTEAVIRGRAISSHIQHHFYLLSRKIVERNGLSGEHYIARTSKEMRQMLVSAIGGGIVVVVMTIFKTLLLRAEPAPIFLAIGLWIIYAVGFLGMQFLGFTLATKIPSFTASHLARILKNIRKKDSQDFSKEFRQIGKSQLVALIGNLLGVIPLALLIAFIANTFMGHTGLMDERYAAHTLHDINPIFSGAIFMAALTGVELWLSSLCGGWFENWVVFKGFPEAIEHHPKIKQVFGIDWAKWAAAKVQQHASGVATNVSLGFLFGFVPLLGIIIGLNLSGHHVTISTAAATFSFSELGATVSWADVLFTSLGLTLIGLMNFFVSFALALIVAANAQKMSLRRVWYYLKARP
jgi:site-specific recombinase